MSSRRLRSRIGPELETAVLSIKKDEITLRGARQNLLPTLDVFGYYGAQGIGGAFNPASCQIAVAFGEPCTPFAASGYSDVLGNLVNSSSRPTRVSDSPSRSRSVTAPRRPIRSAH